MKPAVLVVDDEPSIAEALRLILERDGYVVETAGNIAEASTRTDGRDFAVALVDLVLPDGDGLSLLKILKGRDPDIEVIIMTGHGSISKAVEATKEGAFYFVTKPFDSAEMLTLLGKALERRHLLAETSDLRRQLAEQLGYGRCSAARRRCAGCSSSSTPWPPRTPTCSSWARAGRARSWPRMPCTPRARAPMGRSSRSTAPPSPRT